MWDFEHWKKDPLSQKALARIAELEATLREPTKFRVNADGGRNPLIIVEADQVKVWLRQIADDAGFADRETCSFQLSVPDVFYADNYHHDVPQLLIMVSNVPNSRQK